MIEPVSNADELDRLRAEVARLTAERDEARRLACDSEAALGGLMFDDPRLAKPRFIAKQKNWDCF